MHLYLAYYTIFFIENCFFNHATLFMFHMNYSQAWILPFRQFSRASSSFYTICRKNNSTYHIHVSLYYILLLVDLHASKYFAFGKFNLSALYNKLWLTQLLYSKTDHFFVDRYILAVASPTSIHQVGLHWNGTVTFPLKDEKTC